MTDQAIPAETANSGKQSVYRLGFWTSILIVAEAVARVIAGTTAPARLGSNCPFWVEMGYQNLRGTYLYTNVANLFPPNTSGCIQRC